MDYNYSFRALLHAPIYIIFITIIFIVIFYLLKAIGLMKISKNLDQQNSWLAFIPVANSYLLGKLIFKEFWLVLVLTILDIIHFAVPHSIRFAYVSGDAFLMLTSIVSILYLALYYIALYKLYAKISDKAIIMIIFTVLTFGLAAPIFLFAIRNNKVK